MDIRLTPKGWRTAGGADHHPHIPVTLRCGCIAVYCHDVRRVLQGACRCPR